MEKIKFDDIMKANETITSIDVKGKAYAEVNQRIKAFRMLYPEGAITTELLSNDNGVCVMKSTVLNEEGKILGTGLAYERENSSFINKTSYIENCETSAVGRALAMCGIGIDTSVASAEEVVNAINNQNIELTIEEAKTLGINTKKYPDTSLGEILEKGDVGYLNWLKENYKDAYIRKGCELLVGEENDKELMAQQGQLELIKMNYENKKTELVEIMKKFGKKKIEELTYSEAQEIITK